MEASATVTQAGTASNSPDWLAKLKQTGMVPLLIGGAAFIGLVFALVMWASAPEYRVLYSNLSEADGGRIVTQLDTMQVPYQLNGNGTILVPSNDVHKLRLQMAEQGLPQGGNAGFSLMDNQAFGISQFAEQVNFQRALEGELASSMESLGPVLKARVHLAMAKASVFVREREPAKASVILTLHPGRKLGDGQVQAIIHMVSSSVPELAPEQVTVVDQYGSLLSNSNQEDAQIGSKLEYIHQLERSYQERIENILSPILGRDNIQAQVVAEVDFAKREATAERYSPNQTPETAAIRSIQRNLSMQGNGQGASGVPGALSNTPPGVAASPIESITNADEATAADNTNPQQIQQDQVVNYEVDRTVEHVDHQRGQLQRLSVAVVINHRSVLDEEGVPQLVPRSEEELDYINRLVRQAMGFSEVRGDQLEVVNSVFVRQRTTDEQLPWYEQPSMVDFIKQLARYVVAGIGVLLLYLLILRPLLKRYTPAPTVTEPVETRDRLRAVVGDDDDAVAANGSSRSRRAGGGYADDDELEVDDNTPSDPFHWPKQQRNASYIQALAKAKEAAQSNPRQVARILQNWMNEDDHV
ncbi:MULTISPECIES: flagellar basal-body MS-ring/collar protein FliF [Idiomarina]|uniref:flagellar basal-body MS-ring/collar protein FliF n=1 Tax=Idiomarina TaxID=135575 RepID=UPI00129C7564|nr:MULTISPECIES: flagellar basal-body MS-ring/collar protein FliF [Idiomarina]MRJ42106.1 flagellar basal body M-ring protein FliF [Idiomarina sp. FeN1]NCU57031.1 flagellar basal body M-ring protein FliF [Idiomarina sp. FenA--70]NCU59740.1 flagellar basal body M-ring protein FliF [Idiomarina sp. FenBw--71]UUN13268.1 flagellar M-ring protein FliF [Idiomarina loihiensis]